MVSQTEAPSYIDGYVEYVFENVVDYSQLDGNLVKGILRCVPGSGMNTTDEDTLHHIEGDVVTVYTDDKTQEVVAFSSTAFGSPNEIFKSSDYSDVLGCYFAGATVTKDRQSTGLYKKMNERRVGIALDRGIQLIYTRTQNPRVQSGIQAVLDDCIERGEIAGYSFDKLVVPGCYGHMLTLEKPVDEKVSFDDLDYEKGDAYVLLFTLQLLPKES